jgi:hypothetical protein
MPNLNKPFGLRPIRTLNGSPYNGAVQKFIVPSTYGTSIFIGDPVTLGGTAVSINNEETKYPTVIKGAKNGVWVGVVVGIQPVYGDLDVDYAVSGTTVAVLVATDPNLVFEIQGDVDAFDLTDIGLNASITVSTGVAATGVSNAVLDQSTAAVTATFDFAILGVGKRIGNETDTAATYPTFEVRLNNHQYVNAATGL